MTRRRIRGLLLLGGIVAGIKVARDATMSRNRRRCPEIIDGMTASAPVKPIAS